MGVNASFFQPLDAARGARVDEFGFRGFRGFYFQVLNTREMWVAL